MTSTMQMAHRLFTPCMYLCSSTAEQPLKLKGTKRLRRGVTLVEKRGQRHAQYTTVYEVVSYSCSI